MITFSEQQVQKWQQAKSKFIFPDLPDDLLNYYETVVLADCIPIRAEKYESPEHSAERAQFDEPPLNVQNPNFTVLIDLVQKINSVPASERAEAVQELQDFVKIFADYKLEEYSYIPDIRCIRDLDLAMAYFRAKI